MAKSKRGEKQKMVKVDSYEIPEGLHYSKEWFWVKIENGKAKMGITDYAQKQLREIVFVELPSVGGTLKANEPFGSVESVKAVSDLIAPLSGTIEQINQEVTNKPELLNEDPYRKGWLLVIAPNNLDAELTALMDFNTSVEWHKSLIAKG